MEKFIKEEVKKTIKKAEKIYNRSFDDIETIYNLKGKSAGMFCFRRFTTNTNINTMKLRFNLDISNLNPKKSTKDTIIHEVGHYITHVLVGGEYVRPHGKKWKSVTSALGGSTKRCHSLKTATSTKKKPQFEYKCGCTTHLVSVLINKRMIGGQTRICNKCKQILVKA